MKIEILHNIACIRCDFCGGLHELRSICMNRRLPKKLVLKRERLNQVFRLSGKNPRNYREER